MSGGEGAWRGRRRGGDRTPRTPLGADATLRIASVTKTLTAATILRLVEDEKLVLAPGDLLQHTSGPYDYAEDLRFQAFDLAHPRHRWTRADLVRFGHGSRSTRRCSGCSGAGSAR